MSNLFNNIEAPKLVKSKKKHKKQKLETLFSLSLKNTPGLLYHKLQVNQLAHQTMHCDFEVFNKKGDVFFVEAKEVQLDNKGYGSFPFSRLTQRQALLFYSKFSDFTQSYLLLFFRGTTMKNSLIYMIPIEEWVLFEDYSTKKSANNTDIEKHFSHHKLSFSKVLNLTILRDWTV